MYATEAFRDSVPTVQYMLLSIVCSSVHGRELATQARSLAWVLFVTTASFLYLSLFLSHVRSDMRLTFK